MRVLALDSALSRCSAGVVENGRPVFLRSAEARRGHAGILAAMVRDVLKGAAIVPAALDLVAVTTGPGSFTGIRAGLALAHGIGLGAAVRVIGVTVGEALAAGLPGLGSRALWVAIDNRRGRVFLERGGVVESLTLDDLPAPDGPVAVAGDAAVATAAVLAARDFDVMLTSARIPDPLGVARAASEAALASPVSRLAQPVYVDPPEARPPASGLRPPPVS